MKFQDLSAKLVLAIWSLSFILVGGTEYPKWPWDFKFSLSGPVSGYHCVELLELVPLHYFWFDNHFCVRNDSNFKNIGMLWTAMGPKPGKKCINTNEPSSPYFWWDDYICFNEDVPYDFQWIYGFPLKCTDLPSKSCLSWNEPMLPESDTFWDNYLCASPYPSNTSLPFKTECSRASIQKTGVTLMFGFFVSFFVLYLQENFV